MLWVLPVPGERPPLRISEGMQEGGGEQRDETGPGGGMYEMQNARVPLVLSFARISSGDLSALKCEKLCVEHKCGHAITVNEKKLPGTDGSIQPQTSTGSPEKEALSAAEAE